MADGFPAAFYNLRNTATGMYLGAHPTQTSFDISPPPNCDWFIDWYLALIPRWRLLVRVLSAVLFFRHTPRLFQSPLGTQESNTSPESNAPLI